MHTIDSHRFRSWSRTGLAAGSAILTAILLVGCSSVPDAINPVSWYDGVSNWVSSSDDAEDDTPAPKTEKVSKGLSADRTNAKYTDDTPNREGSPTRPLNPDAVASRAASKTGPLLLSIIRLPIAFRLMAKPFPRARTIALRRLAMKPSIRFIAAV